MSEAEDSLLELALVALEEPASEQASSVLTRIVNHFEGRFGDNQKEVASSLQGMAKQIEGRGRTEMAMEFKQRTTAIMLVHSMERRRGKGSTLTGLPALAPIKPTLFEGIIYLLYFTRTFDADLDLYQHILEAKLSWEKTESHGRIAALKLSREPLVILVENKGENTLPSPMPVLAVSDTFAASTQLLNKGFERLGEIATPAGFAQIFQGQEAMAIIRRS